MQYGWNAARLALAVDDSVPAVHISIGKLQLWRMEHEEALVHMKRAVALAPDDPFAHFQLGDSLAMCGLADEALASIDRAMALHPSDACS